MYNQLHFIPPHQKHSSNLMTSFLTWFRGYSEVGQKSEPQLLDVESLPIGIRVSHSPNPVSAMQGGPSNRPYTWLHQTTVESIGKSLQIVEFGGFGWNGEQWILGNYTGKPFTSGDFASWYSCPDAIIEFGKEYSDPNNWTGGDNLSSSMTKWYFIGTDEAGNSYRGDAVIEMLPQLAKVT